ncbi:MAG: biotin synthase BioB, partial [Cardiobacteriaceae bacterium]|nr:biotin synthase BioB [Cardiobacteriaceae bacterium]
MTRWTLEQAQNLHALPLFDLLYRAQTVHRAHHDPNAIQISTLLSIKTGACPEDCKYCPQSARYQTGVQRETLMKIEDILDNAKNAKAQGATRFCMGAAWRDPHEKDIPYLQQIIREVKALGLETCMTLGMLDQPKAQALADAGLDYYNHNLDTSRDYYDKIITTRCYDDRLQTLDNVRNAGMKICAGGILGMGEGEHDRLAMLV